MKSLYTNRDQVGDFMVTVIANSNAVASFQTATKDDAQTLTNEIAKKRKKDSLPTSSAYAQEITGKDKRGLKLGPKHLLTV